MKNREAGGGARKAAHATKLAHIRESLVKPPPDATNGHRSNLRRSSHPVVYMQYTTYMEPTRDSNEVGRRVA